MNVIFLYIVLVANLFSTPGPELTINISNIASIKGNIIIGIFDSDKDFLKDGAAFKNYTLEVEGTTETIIISDLPEGNYAVSLFHDENSDNVCNRNFLGIPKEGYGFSNNVKPKLSAPSYKDCKFTLNKNQVLNIVLIN